MDNALLQLSSSDAVLAKLIDYYPAPTFIKHDNYYQALVSSIISQQLSVKAANAIENRLKALFKNNFPSPSQILETDIETLRSVGISRPKARYIHDLALNITEGIIDFSDIDGLSNQQIISKLTQVKGIGEWTVHMFLLFCMNRLDILPIGDLGIRNGVTRLYDFNYIATPQDVVIIAEKNNWHPYESVASWYIWQSLENTPK